MYLRLLGFVIFIHLVGSVYAQGNNVSSVPDTLTLALADAEKIMISQNLILLARQYDISAARALVLQAKLWDNPSMYLETNPYNGQTRKFFAYFPSDQVNANGQYMGNETIGSIDQVIKTAGKRSNLVKLNRINAEIAEYVFYDALRSLKYTLRDDFSLLIQFQQSIKLLNEEIVAADRLVNITQEQLLKGNFAEKDLIRLQALEFSLQMMKRDFLKQSADTQAEMKTLLGVKPNVYLVAVRDTAIYSRPIPPVVEPLLETAQEKRADLKAMEGQFRAAEMNVRLQKSLAVPDADVTVNYTRYSNYIIDYIGLGLRVSLPLLNQNQGNIRNAKESVKSQQSSYSNYQKQVNNEVVAAYSQLQNSKSAYESFDRPFIGKFDTYFKKLLINFQRRVIGLIEFIDFFETYRDTKLSSFNLEQDYFEAMELLNFKVGTEVINTK
ncbi:MAG: TolC family protein [Bacteroidetes bacterium]|nr:TolC family protein [Bacteroidota bacterium]